MARFLRHGWETTKASPSLLLPLPLLFLSVIPSGICFSLLLSSQPQKPRGPKVRAIKDVLRATPNQTAQQIAAAFKPASRTRVQEILDTLTALGQTREVQGSYLL